MSKFQHDVMLRIVKLLDVALVTLPFAACWFWYYINGIRTPLSWVGNGAVLLFYAVLFVVLGKIYDAFQISMQHISDGNRSATFTVPYSTTVILYVRVAAAQ